jgi:hypothetical protein
VLKLPITPVVLMTGTLTLLLLLLLLLQVCP